MRKSILALVCLSVLLISLPVVAQTVAPASAPAAVPAESLGLKGLLKGLISGSLVGVILAYLGYLKDKSPDKKWDLKQAMPTILFGSAVGAFMGWDQKDISGWVQIKDNVATVVVAELLGKVGFRNGSPVIGNVISSLIGKKVDPS